MKISFFKYAIPWRAPMGGWSEKQKCHLLSSSSGFSSLSFLLAQFEPIREEICPSITARCMLGRRWKFMTWKLRNEKLFYQRHNLTQPLVTGMNACERKSYVFLRKELPVRLANIMKEIALLPDTLLRTYSVGLVSNWYAKSFEEVIDFEQSEPTTDNLSKFCSTLIHIRDRHTNVVQTMANGILELKESQNNLVEPGMETSIQYFLDRFYMSRISIRMLINQHSKLRSIGRSFLSNFFFF